MALRLESFGSYVARYKITNLLFINFWNQNRNLHSSMYKTIGIIEKPFGEGENDTVGERVSFCVENMIESCIKCMKVMENQGKD